MPFGGKGVPVIVIDLVKYSTEKLLSAKKTAVSRLPQICVDLSRLLQHYRQFLLHKMNMYHVFFNLSYFGRLIYYQYLPSLEEAQTRSDYFLCLISRDFSNLSTI